MNVDKEKIVQMKIDMLDNDVRVKQQKLEDAQNMVTDIQASINEVKEKIKRLQ